MEYQSSFVRQKMESKDNGYDILHAENQAPMTSATSFLEKNHPIFEESMRVLQECQREYDRVANEYGGIAGKVMIALNLTTPKKRLEKRVANLEFNISVLEEIVTHSEQSIKDLHGHYMSSSRAKIVAGRSMQGYEKVGKDIEEQAALLIEDYNRCDDEALKLEIENELFSLEQDRQRVKGEQEECAAEIIFLDNALGSLNKYKSAMGSLTKTARAALNSGRLIKREVESSLPYVVKGQETLSAIQDIYQNIQALKTDLSRIYEVNLRSVAEVTKYHLDPSTARLVDPGKTKADDYSSKIKDNMAKGRDTLIDQAMKIIDRDRNKKKGKDA
ncbi:hypothetical protein JW968_02685 [Candidatus Woesearchaeota archaeon]|nr:hypothetical protein [Candidatus Woesearchaeota archaeon]